MKRFLEIFKKVDGVNVLRQYTKSHVLFFALIQTVLLGFSKKSLEIVRLSVDNKIYRRLRKQNQKFIEAYKNKHRSDHLVRKSNPVVWTIWLQGMDKAPAIVQKCYESMKKNIIDREIVVITEENYSDYVSFPDYIMQKYRKGSISKVHFADLLRIELLTVYGGTWMDGTVFCSGNIKQRYMLDSELFLFQTLKPGLDGHCRSVSSWMISAYSNSKILLLARALLHNYWKTHEKAIEYFILHDFIQMAIEEYPEEWNEVVPFCNSVPHVLLLRLFDKYDSNVWEALKEQTSFHKLSHKFDAEMFRKKGTYYDIILNHLEDDCGVAEVS